MQEQRCQRALEVLLCFLQVSARVGDHQAATKEIAGERGCVALKASAGRRLLEREEDMLGSPPSKENSSGHKGIPTEIRYIILGAIIDKVVSPAVLGPVIGAIFGIVTTLLFLLKVGLLRLAQLPATTIVLLILLEIVLIAFRILDENFCLEM